MPEAISQPTDHNLYQGSLLKRQSYEPIELASKGTDLLGKHPAGNGLLEGGRNLLLESAQEATLMSVTTLGLPRQLNRLPPRPSVHFFALDGGQSMDLGVNINFGVWPPNSFWRRGD
jgi:hypothetical protein